MYDIAYTKNAVNMRTSANLGEVNGFVTTQVHLRKVKKSKHISIIISDPFDVGCTPYKH